MESKCTINNNGDKIWRNEMGEFHREDGPAIEYANGNKEWYRDGNAIGKMALLLRLMVIKNGG
jgi:hypothetical protein